VNPYKLEKKKTSKCKPKPGVILGEGNPMVGLQRKRRKKGKINPTQKHGAWGEGGDRERAL